MGPFTEVVDVARVARFQISVEDSNIQDVPPTFLTVFRKPEFDLFQSLGVELKRVLHAEQEYRFERPLKIGEELTYQCRLANVLEKKGAQSFLSFLVIETEFFSGHEAGTQARVAFSKTTVVVREPI